MSRRLLLGLVALGLLLVGCTAGNIPPVYRIGLVAPFEGQFRATGYDVVYPVRLAIQEAASAANTSAYRVELVAYDDRGDPAQARLQAAALAADPAVLAVIGHWQPETTATALPVYETAGLPLIALSLKAESPANGLVFLLDAPPAQYARLAEEVAAEAGVPADAIARNARTDDTTGSVQIGGSAWGTGYFRLLTLASGSGAYEFLSPLVWPADLPDGDGYRERITNSGLYVPEPGGFSALAYDAAHAALAAIAQAGAHPTRAGTAQALTEIDQAGLSGPLRFDASGYRQGATLRLYRWGTAAAPERLAEWQTD